MTGVDPPGGLTLLGTNRNARPTPPLTLPLPVAGLTRATGAGGELEPLHLDLLAFIVAGSTADGLEDRLGMLEGACPIKAGVEATIALPPSLTRLGNAVCVPCQRGTCPFAPTRVFGCMASGLSLRGWRPALLKPVARTSLTFVLPGPTLAGRGLIAVSPFKWRPSRGGEAAPPLAGESAPPRGGEDVPLPGGRADGGRLMLDFGLPTVAGTKGPLALLDASLGVPCAVKSVSMSGFDRRPNCARSLASK
mmetsp:Transcript_45800/g.106399  ORF Transcript_45800/g.106399 Transcript_45800/m.106399 type:complete len:250 (+) Transcript_45800:551-1300(+)